MGYTIVLPPDVLAHAMLTAEQRPQNIKHHRPSADPHADLVGALAEHAFAYHVGIPQDQIDSSGGPDGRGDGGWDFKVEKGGKSVLVDTKASRKHPESWVIPAGNLVADWYVFAYVILPATVIFQGMGHRSVLEPMGVSSSVPGKRLVYLTEVQDIKPSHFKATIPRRPKTS